MSTIYCPQCALEQSLEHRYCARCGDRLPRELLQASDAKTTRWFAGVKIGDGDPEGAYLRVSCYREDQVFEAPEGEVRIPGHHVRFSVWIDKEARCVVSIPETEAHELAEFIQESVGKVPSDRSDAPA